MDIIVILLIAVAIIVVLGGAFAFIRNRQRSGSVLAAPAAFSNDSNGSGQ